MSFVDNGMEFKILTEDHLNPSINSNMAQSKFIQSVVKAAQGRPRSTDWYREKIKEFAAW